MSRADWFSDADAASLITDLGDPIIIRWPDGGVAQFNAVDATEDWRTSGDGDGRGHSFSGFDVVIDIHTSHLPTGVGKAQLVPNGTLERVGVDSPAKPLRISDYHPQGQGIVALVCEP